MNDLGDLREDYQSQGLDHSHLNADPVEQFRAWFLQAQAAKLPEPNAMSLATVDTQGQPWQRVVLLKAYDAHGFVFYTNYESRKARHLAGNPRASLLFPWFAMQRQVMVTGQVEKVSLAESVKYFASRPIGSQLGAWVSQQSSVISTRSILEAKLRELTDKFKNGQVPLPSFWGGYRVKPETVEFWQGATSRLHDRFLYSRSGDAWKIDRLAP